MKKSLTVSDYTYELPQDRIALFPLEKRDASKLLVYRNGTIEHSRFATLPSFVPSNALLIFNDTRVIPARLYFKKETGATIEIFLLHPILPSTLLVETMVAQNSSTWECTIGNLKKWGDNIVLSKTIGDITLTATLKGREKGIVEFKWNGSVSFAEVISRSGETPLPPYLKRDAEESDKDRYQTVYAHYDGAVAAPTAGLHFTPAVMDELKQKGISTDFVTLHVSAGTFQPIKVSEASAHVMHNEQVLVRRDTVETLLKENQFVIPVGTTSMRTLESLYWFGVKLLRDENSIFNILQDDPYTIVNPPPAKDALTAVREYMKQHQLETLIGETSIFIMPGYTFRICQALITNFHQPGSTLILLVAAFTGENWRRIYNAALENDYRFLSYGDSSILFPDK
jgi:S-adenosylmethionine:tRNA ribosyltransferase-isomerase